MCINYSLIVLVAADSAERTKRRVSYSLSFFHAVSLALCYYSGVEDLSHRNLSWGVTSELMALSTMVERVSESLDHRSECIFN